MSIPKCHRTIGASTVLVDGLNIYETEHAPDPTPCIGSACAMWTPDVGRNAGNESAPAWVTLGDSYNHAKDSREADTGRKRLTVVGWCADNPNREPWPDPAGGGDDA